MKSKLLIGGLGVHQGDESLLTFKKREDVPRETPRLWLTPCWYDLTSLLRLSTEVTFGRGDLSVCPLGGFTGDREQPISERRGVPLGSPQGQTLRVLLLRGHFCASSTAAQRRVCMLAGVAVWPVFTRAWHRSPWSPEISPTISGPETGKLTWVS